MDTIAFWHCFGKHAGEDRDAILSRKEREIRANGWTLWSFSKRTWFKILNPWREQVKKAAPSKVIVYCSDSPKARDPARNPKGCTARASEYQCSEGEPWLRIPESVCVPHPFGGKVEASAFKVARVVRQPTAGFDDRGFEWFGSGRWRKEGPFSTRPGELPTKPGEFLIRPGGKCKLRRVYAILELAPPYVVMIRK
jgi:hypothetical protein